MYFEKVVQKFEIHTSVPVTMVTVLMCLYLSYTVLPR